MAIVREGFESFNPAVTTTTVDETYTLPTGTTLSVLVIFVRGNIDVTELPSWNGTEDFTLVRELDDNARGDNAHTYIYGLVSPTVTTADIDYTVTSNSAIKHVLVNYSGTVTSSVADAIKFLNEDLTWWSSSASTSVLSSGGTSGNTLFLVGQHSGAGDPASNNASFTEIVDDGAGGSPYIAFYVAEDIGGAPSAVTITWGATDQCSAALFEIVPDTDGVSRGATITTFSSSSNISSVSDSHTVDANTTLLLVSISMEANHAISGNVTWNTSENMTLVDQTTSGGSGGLMHVYTYGLVSPTATTANIAYSLDTTSNNTHHTAVNYLGTETASVAAATNLLSEDVNDSATNTSVHSSAGTSGETLYFAGACHGGDADPASNATSFNELADSATGTNNANDHAFYIADLLNSAPAAITVTWSATDENASHFIEIVKAPTPAAFIAKEPFVISRAIQRASSW